MIFAWTIHQVIQRKTFGINTGVQKRVNRPLKSNLDKQLKRQLLAQVVISQKIKKKAGGCPLMTTNYTIFVLSQIAKFIQQSISKHMMMNKIIFLCNISIRTTTIKELLGKQIKKNKGQKVWSPSPKHLHLTD